MLLTAHDYMIQHVNFEKLSSSDEIARDADIRFRRSRISAYAECGISGVMPYPVLCRMARGLPGVSGMNFRLDAA